MNMIKRNPQVAAGILAVAWSTLGWAQTPIQGTVAMLEVWKSGNVAFTLSPSVSTCNGQFILNRSDPGTRNQLATLLTAKATGRTVRVHSSGCIAADDYGHSYNSVAYLYLQE
jgi:hypothetical protein